MSTTITHPAGAPPSTAEAQAPVQFGAVVAAILANALEFYDFIIYALFAVYIGRAFFPTGNAWTSLLLTFATFGVGFIARPIGGLLIGAYADRHGRKPALIMTIVLMALSTGAVGLMPSYETLGVAAPLLLVLARVVQGFSAGGEIGPATAFLLESAPKKKQMFFGSWQMASQMLSSVVAGAIGATLGAILSSEAMQAWGWRVPFLVGISILPVGLYIALRLQETLDVTKAHGSMRAVMADVLASHKATLVFCLLLISGGTITQYFLNYTTTYGLAVLHLPASVALSVSLVLGAAGTVGALLGGVVADRHDRWMVMILPRVLLIVAVWPMLMLLNTHPTATMFLTLIGAFAAVHGFSSSVMIILVPTCFPAKIRTTGLAIAYSLGVMVFGGTAQVMFTWLIGSTGDPGSPAFYLIVANLLSIIGAGLLRSRERAHRDA